VYEFIIIIIIIIMSEEILKFMIFIIHLIQQKILHHDDLKKLKQTDNINFMTVFQNFTTQFIIFSTVKKWKIQNLIHAINSNLNDFIIVENDNAKMCYEAKQNKKKLQHDEYKIINNEKKENNESEKKIIKLFN